MKDSFKIQIRKSYHFVNGKVIHAMRDDSKEKPFIVMDGYGMVIGETDNYNDAKEMI
jgi:hypothetical protein